MRIVIAITGASGTQFGLEFVRMCPGEKYLICSRWGKSVLAQETGSSLEQMAPHVKKVFSNDDLSSPFASGSNPFDAMVIVPCSISSLSKISAGIGDTLITRAAMVALKERRKLILCVRETPLSSLMLESMLKLSQAGAIVMPVSPAFYQKDESLEQMAVHFSERIIQLLDPQYLSSGWKKEAL